MSDETTGWEDFKEPEISAEELEKRLVPAYEQITSDQMRPYDKQGVLDKLEEMMKQPIDRFGTCPTCQASWDGGDIYEKLLKKDILAVNIGDAKRTAAMYGWTEHDKKHFSTLLTYEFEYGIFVQCHKCGHLFNQDTSKEYKSLFDLKQEYHEQKELL